MSVFSAAVVWGVLATECALFQVIRAIRRDWETKGPDWALARSGYRSASELAGHLAFERMVEVAG